MGLQDLVAWGAFALLAVSIITRLVTRRWLSRPAHASNRALFWLSLLALGAAFLLRDHPVGWSVSVAVAALLAVLSQWLWTRPVGVSEDDEA